MRKDRLTHLEEWIKANAGRAIPFVYSDGVLRLIEECGRLRKALRAAEKGAMWQAEKWAEAGGSGGPEMRDYLKAKIAMDDARAFAEEEAP